MQSAGSPGSKIVSPGAWFLRAQPKIGEPPSDLRIARLEEPRADQRFVVRCRHASIKLR